MLKDMTEGNPLRLMIRFSIPLLLVNALQLVYTLADSAVLGRMLGVEAFASVGATASTFWLVLSAVLGMSHGFSAVFAQRFGAKDTEGLRRAFVTAVWLTAVIGVFGGLAGAFGSGGLMRLLGTPPELLHGASVYLGILLGGLPVTFMYNLIGAILRALGDSRTPLRAMIYSTVLNIVLDVALVIPFGIAGAAIATLFSQLCACVYCFRVLHMTGVMKGAGRKWDAASSKALLRMGLPFGFGNAAIAVGGLIVQRTVNGYGTEFIAGVAAAKRMYSLLMIAGGAVEAATATFVAQNFGVGNMERVKQGVKTGRRMMLISAAGIMTLTLLCGHWILGLLVEGERVAAVLDAGVWQLRLLALGLPVVYMLFLYRSALQGLGRPLIPLLSGFTELIFRIASVLLLTPLWGEWGVLLSDPIGWLPAAALLALAYGTAVRRITT